jgi:single-strand DNA-binding protein
MNTIPIVVVGNLTGDPELRFTPNGNAVCKLHIAHNPRTFKDGQWVEGETTFMPVTVWKGLAENAAESLRKGDRVIAAGSLTTERWEDKEGEEVSRVVLNASCLGPDLLFHTAEVKKMVRTSSAKADDEFTEDKKSERKAERPRSSRSRR